MLNNILHIITPLFRFENLEQIYNSILMDEDIIWHICKSNKREDINLDFIKQDKRIKIYNVDCEDYEGAKKRNAALSKITNGYFCFLDDDTIFLEKMYEKYRECCENNYVGMLIGQQIYPDNQLRLIAGPPYQNAIDTGNVLCHWSCLKNCSWPVRVFDGVLQNDFIFWDSVYNFFGKKCAIFNQPISCYNKLSKNNKWTKEKNISDFIKKPKKIPSKKT